MQVDVSTSAVGIALFRCVVPWKEAAAFSNLKFVFYKIMLCFLIALIAMVLMAALTVRAFTSQSPSLLYIRPHSL